MEHPSETKHSDKSHCPTEQDKTSQYLSFTLGNEEYGVDILSVQEIRGWESVSRIPNVPSYEKGVVNLRGSIVPIIDLREKLHIKFTDYTQLTVVVVLQTTDDNKTRTMGVVVDSVSDVITINNTEVQNAPDFGAKASNEFVNGLISVDERMVILLNVDKLLKLEEIEVIH